VSITNYVSLTITRDSVGVARAGFGVPLLVSYNAAWAERVRSYGSLADVGEDFATTTPEYMAAQVFFGQSPRLQTLKIGRGALPPTQRYTLSIGTPVNSHTYTINVVGEGYTGTASYTSDASATDGEIVVGLVAALNAVSGNNYTAAGTTSPFTVTADAAGDWFSLEVANADIANMAASQNHADPGIATDLAAIALEDPEWYALATVYNSKALVAAASAWVNAQSKIYVYDASDTTCVTTVVASADDTFEDGFDAAYGRVSGHYHPDPSDFFACGLMGRCLPLEPGSETWALKRLSGPSTVSLTSTHRTNILARNANSYERVSGIGSTFYGTMFDGEYIDVVRGLDWLQDDMQASVFEVLAGNDKIPYTNAGIAVVENAIKGSLQRAEGRGIIAAGWVVTVPDVSAIADADKTARRLPDLKFTATLAGAVHSTVITGVVSV
jgi:hypothetical protein